MCFPARDHEDAVTVGGKACLVPRSELPQPLVVRSDGHFPAVTLRPCAMVAPAKSPQLPDLAAPLGVVAGPTTESWGHRAVEVTRAREGVRK